MSVGVGRVWGIHALRAVAASMVVVHHAQASVDGSFAWPRWGDAGVDIFFVISGFVMMLTTQGPTTPGDFAKKRILRIVPLYWLALIWAGRHSIDANLLRDFFFVPHFSTQYPDAIEPVLIQGWTLNLEMLFYAVFAACLFLPRARTLAVLAALGLLPFISRFDGVVAQFYSQSIVLEFGFGVLLFVAWKRWGMPEWGRSTYSGLVVIGFVLLANGHDYAPRALFQGLPALLIVWASLGAVQRPTLGLLGDASYATYVFHWSAMGLTLKLALPPNTVVAVSIAVAILAGVVIHLVIERPLTELLRGRTTMAPTGIADAPQT